MLKNDPSTLVDTQWLAEHLHDTNLRVFDASYFLHDKTRDPEKEYLEGHIRGAQFFDITTIADTESAWPNTIPSAQQFKTAVEAKGVSNHSQIIAYDRLGLFSAARVWWLFRLFGHTSVAVLDGGLPKWLAENRELESGSLSLPPGTFNISRNPDLLESADGLLARVMEKQAASCDHLNYSSAGLAQIVDVRSAERFSGLTPEPRTGLRSGRIPESINLPFQMLLNDDSTFKSDKEMEAVIAAAGVKFENPITASCGSGVTACILALGLARLGKADAKVFDGSWTEWGSREELPIDHD